MCHIIWNFFNEFACILIGIKSRASFVLKDGINHPHIHQQPFSLRPGVRHPPIQMPLTIEHGNPRFLGTCRYRYQQQNADSNGCDYGSYDSCHNKCSVSFELLPFVSGDPQHPISISRSAESLDAAIDPGAVLKTSLSTVGRIPPGTFEAHIRGQADGDFAA